MIQVVKKYMVQQSGAAIARPPFEINTKEILQGDSDG
jgi:hypothetical protein